MLDKDVVIEQLVEENRKLRGTVAFLNSQIEELKEQIAKLKKNSRNSSKPPSSDIVRPPKPPPKQGEGKRKQGAQPGHPKHEHSLFVAKKSTFGVVNAYHTFCVKSPPAVSFEGPHLLRQVGHG